MAGQDVKGDMVAPSPANKQPVSTVSCSAVQSSSHHLRMRRTAQLHLVTMVMRLSCSNAPSCCRVILACAPQVRVLALAAALAIAARGSGYLPARAAAFAHLLSWAILVGTNLWTTFFAGLTMFKNLPRQVFGKLQVRGGSHGNFPCHVACLRC
jgi:Domain of unknown function (DUF4149)